MSNRVEDHTSDGNRLRMPERDSGMRSRGPGVLSRIVQSCPITSVVVAPYVVLVIPIGLIKGNPKLDFVVGLLTLAVLSSLAVELVFLRLRPPRMDRKCPRNHARVANLFRIAKVVSAVSIVTDIAFAVLGGGTIFAQVRGGTQSSVLLQVAGLFDSWTVAGFALLVGSHIGGHITKGRFYRWVAALIGSQVAVATMTAITNPLIGIVIIVALFGAIFGLVGMRWVLLLGIIIILVWPTVFQIRNEIRSEGGVDVSARDSAYDQIG